MAKLFLWSLGISLCLTSFALSASPRQDCTIKEQEVSPRLELKEIQSQINKAFGESMQVQKADKLDQLIRALEQSKANTSASVSKLITYWHSYALYYKAIYHIQAKQPSEASKAVSKALELLEEIPTKDSEEYAMMARLEGLGLAFAGPKAPIMAQSMVKHGHLAMKLGPQNPRAYVVAGINDFYTPKSFGGRTMAKKYLTKALELSAQGADTPYAPSWGREEAYEYLIRYLVEEEKGEGAKKLQEQALKEFPNSFMIKTLQIK